jgi:catechol 1,2-dioxygenase
MNILGRRDFLRRGSLGLAVAGLGSLALRADAAPTEPSGDAGAFGKTLAGAGGVTSTDVELTPPQVPTKFQPTEDNILGPYYRRGAPFRGKITPPLEPGDVMVIRGRVWGFDTKKPLADAELHIWQANAQGRYDNDDPQNPPAPGIFRNRARLQCDETGYYEYETIKPGRYKIGPDAWRPAHIHYMIGAPGYKTLVTQLYFKGDPENSRDQFIKPSLIIDPETIKTPGGTFQLGTFDIVLAKA